MGTQDGLFIINEAIGKEEHIMENTLHPYGLVSNLIYSLYQDRNRGLWLGTIYNGVDYMPRNGMLFNNYIHIPETNTISSRNIHEMLNDSMGRIWIASEQGDIDIYDPRTGVFRKVPTTRYKGGNNRLALLQDGDKVWSGIFKMV